jgi:predicted O-methyltransferase YrrM
MDEKLTALLKELESFGAENDARVTDYKVKMLNITPETGAFLALLVRAIKARRVLEIGTSNGYSTLWLAYAVQQLGGQVVTVDRLTSKVDLARRNFERAGLSSSITPHLSEAGRFFEEQSNSSYDFIFLDSDRGEYVGWWPSLRRILAAGGLLVVDNAVSHESELRAFVELVHSTNGYMTSLVPVGKGELVILKEF